jgi:hypothetical protein
MHNAGSPLSERSDSQCPDGVGFRAGDPNLSADFTRFDGYLHSIPPDIFMLLYYELILKQRMPEVKSD